MYIGDIPATTVVAPTPNELAAGMVATLVAFQTKGLVRLVSAGIATWVGYKAIKSQ